MRLINLEIDSTTVIFSNPFIFVQPSPFPFITINELFLYTIYFRFHKNSRTDGV